MGVDLVSPESTEDGPAQVAERGSLEAEDPGRCSGRGAEGCSWSDHASGRQSGLPRWPCVGTFLPSTFTRSHVAQGFSASNQLHLYWVTQYDVKPGMTRDQANGRPWKRMRINPMFSQNLWDRTTDSRIYKTFKWTFLCNNPSGSTKWAANYYYINPATNAATTEVIYSPPANLVGQPKQKAGDTCIYLSSKYYGALSAYSTTFPKQTLLNDANYRKMLVDIAKAPYLYIPQDMYDTNNFPEMLKWLDDQRPDMNFQAGSRNFHRMRLAETYLIAAEAYGRKTERIRI